MNNSELSSAVFVEEEYFSEEIIDDRRHLSCSDEKIQDLLDNPDEIGRRIGFKDLTKDLHGEWIKEMVYGLPDYTLQAHRGSYKSSCLAVAISLLLVIDAEAIGQTIYNTAERYLLRTLKGAFS